MYALADQPRSTATGASACALPGACGGGGAAAEEAAGGVQWLCAVDALRRRQDAAYMRPLYHPPLDIGGHTRESARMTERRRVRVMAAQYLEWVHNYWRLRQEVYNLL